MRTRSVRTSHALGLWRGANDLAVAPPAQNNRAWQDAARNASDAAKVLRNQK